MQVREVMRRDVFTLREDELLSETLRAMVQRGIRHAPVVRDGAVVGVLSDRNVLGHRARYGRDGKVSEAMIEEPHVIAPDVSVATASALMSTRKIGCLPVVEGSRLVGIITTTDLLTVLGQEEIPTRAAI